MPASQKRSTRVREEYKAIASGVNLKIRLISVVSGVSMLFVHWLIVWLCPHFWPDSVSTAIADNLKVRESCNITDNHTAYFVVWVGYPDPDHNYPIGISDTLKTAFGISDTQGAPDLLHRVDPTYKTASDWPSSPTEPFKHVRFIPALNDYGYAVSPAPSESLPENDAGYRPLLARNDTVANELYDYSVAMSYARLQVSPCTAGQLQGNSPCYISANSRILAKNYATDLKHAFQAEIVWPLLLQFVELALGTIFAFLLSNIVMQKTLKRMKRSKG